MKAVSIYEAGNILGAAPPEFSWTLAAWYAIGLGVLSILVAASIYFLYWKQGQMEDVAKKIYGVSVFVLSREDINILAFKRLGRDLSTDELRWMGDWLAEWFQDWPRAVEEGLEELPDKLKTKGGHHAK